MIPLLAVLAQSASGLAVDYVPFQGLSVKLDGVPIVLNSSFQYYEDNWARGIYSSYWNPVEIDRPNSQTVRVRFQAQADYVSGSQVYTRTADGVKGTFEFEWKGTKPVRVEHTASVLWSPFFEAAPITQDGIAGALIGSEVRRGSSVEDRLIGRRAEEMVFDAPRARVSISSSQPAILYDARGHTQPWAEGKEVAWYGFQNMPIRPGEILTYTVEWKVSPKRLPATAPIESFSHEPVISNRVKRAEAAAIPLIPQPKDRRDGAGNVNLSGGVRFAGESASLLQRAFDEVIESRWQVPGGTAFPVQTRLGGSLPADGYSLSITITGATLEARDVAGLRNGAMTLAGLVKPSSGQLIVPQTTIRDWPSLGWRGVHMFVGPEALTFQSRLMKQVLAPVKFNNVVLQCERTDWTTQPGIKTAMTMSREDLRSLVIAYREHGIEPTPLIQSLGHLEWFFANNKNLDFAYNRDVPYTLDSRKQAAREAIKSIWLEAIQLIQPKTIHIGFDEIGNRGMPNDRFLKTRLWQAMLPELKAIATANRIDLMLWGDMMLAPGEANDAIHGDDAENASARRNLLPPETFIADWHYENNPNPDRYKSLALWKRLGQRPIAATWNQPNNIYGFAHAAIREGTPGLLQTTWAGYESNERAFISGFPQFAAYLLAAEYAWSGRQDRPEQLPYKVTEVLKRMYFDGPQPVRDVSGTMWALGQQTTEVAGYQFRTGSPLAFLNQLRNDGFVRPKEVRVPVERRVSQINLLLDCQTWLFEGETAGVVEVALSDGSTQPFPILYGHDIRMRRDQRPTYRTANENGLAVMNLKLKGETVREIRLIAANPNAGLRLHGMSVQ
ncbi:MAG: hypothetical protein KF812_03195 [Fimbriimonadaceae bacterium]|nr:hypothetical protein [Fimbriimonadaceae bacterium]